MISRMPHLGPQVERIDWSGVLGDREREHLRGAGRSATSIAAATMPRRRMGVRQGAHPPVGPERR